MQTPCIYPSILPASRVCKLLCLGDPEQHNAGRSLHCVPSWQLSAMGIFNYAMQSPARPNFAIRHTTASRTLCGYSEEKPDTPGLWSKSDSNCVPLWSAKIYHWARLHQYQ